jgi:hypothetical protein
MAAKRKEISDFQAFANDFKSTNNMIKQKLMVGETDRKLMQAIRFNEKTAKKRELLSNKISLEKDVFLKGFPPANLPLKDTLTIKISPKYNHRPQPKCKMFSIVANPGTMTYRVKE